MHSTTFNRVLILSGFAYLLCLMTGLFVAGYIPPASPYWTAEQLSGHLNEYGTGVQLCGLLLIICSPLYITFSTAISSFMRRAGATYEFVAAQLGLAILGSTTFLISGVLFVVIGFRPEAFSVATYVLNDFAWIILLLPWPSFLLQNVTIGWVILQDKRGAIKNWVGYLNFWVAISFVPSTLLCFFKQGPFAWNGILVFWLAASVFVLWFVVMGISMFKELNHSISSAD